MKAYGCEREAQGGPLCKEHCGWERCVTTEAQAPEGGPVLRKAAQQALEALEGATGYMSDKTTTGKEVVAAITNLRAALAAQPTRSQALADAGYTRRSSWKSLPGAIDGDDEAPSPAPGTAHRR